MFALIIDILYLLVGSLSCFCRFYRRSIVIDNNISNSDSKFHMINYLIFSNDCRCYYCSHIRI